MIAMDLENVGGGDLTYTKALSNGSISQREDIVTRAYPELYCTTRRQTQSRDSDACIRVQSEYPSIGRTISLDRCGVSGCRRMMS